MIETGLIVYECGDAITDALLRREGLRQLHHAWLTARERRGGRIPAWSGLDPADFPACVDNLALLDIIDGGADYRYTFYGVDMARHFGRDLTGCSTSELPRQVSGLFISLYQRMIADREPFFSRTDSAPSVAVAQLDRLVLPLSDDGTNVTGIASGSFPIAWRTPPDLHALILQSLDQLDEGIAIMDARGELAVWNQAYVRLSGIDPALCVRGTPLREILGFFARRGDYGSDADPEALVDERLARVTTDALADESRTLPDGRIVEIRTGRLPDGSYSTIWVDVTRRRRDEAELNRHRQSLEELVAQRTAELADKTRTLTSILDHSPASINLKDREGRYVLVNRAFARARGRTEEALIGLTAHDVFPAPSADAFMASERRVFESGKPVREEATVPNPDGTARDVLIVRFPVIGGDGSVASAGMMAMDITERRHAERELERYRDHLEELVERRSIELATVQADLLRSERLAAIGELMATVSHELRNPLATVRASLSVLRGRLGDDAGAVGSVLDRIDRNVTRCMNMTHELLDFARDRPLVAQSVDVDQWLARTLDELDLPAGVSVTRRLGAGVPAQIDRERLRQALVNLVDNGWQALEGDAAAAPHVEVTSTTAGDRVEIAVRDNGPGIDAGALDRLFEPLYSTKPRGVGLGLPLVRRIVEQHGGGVSVQSTPDAGACVTIWLPVDGSADL